MATTDIHIKVDSEIKSESEKVLEKIGISTSDLVNMTLRRVVYERRIPFDTQVPDTQMPENMSIDSLKELEDLLDKRLDNDDGTRYSTDEIRKMFSGKRERALA